MSLLMFAGSAQFAALAVLVSGGDAMTAVVAGTLINLRYALMSVSVTPSMPRGLIKRCLFAYTITDPGWALSARSGGRFDIWFMVGTFLPQWVVWQVATVAGALFGSVIADPEKFGFDVVLPAFFLAILLGGELRRGKISVIVALFGGLIALVLIPFTPPGVPLILASAAALLVLLDRGKGSRAETEAR